MSIHARFWDEIKNLDGIDDPSFLQQENGQLNSGEIVRIISPNFSDKIALVQFHDHDTVSSSSMLTTVF